MFLVTNFVVLLLVLLIFAQFCEPLIGVTAWSVVLCPDPHCPLTSSFPLPSASLQAQNKCDYLSKKSMLINYFKEKGLKLFFLPFSVNDLNTLKLHCDEKGVMHLQHTR